MQFCFLFWLSLPWISTQNFTFFSCAKNVTCEGFSFSQILTKAERVLVHTVLFYLKDVHSYHKAVCNHRLNSSLTPCNQIISRNLNLGELRKYLRKYTEWKTQHCFLMWKTLQWNPSITIKSSSYTCIINIVVILSMLLHWICSYNE